MSDHEILPDASLDGASDGRRDFLKKAGIGVAAAWAAPVILSSPAHAQGSPPLPLPIEFVAAGAEVSSSTGTVTLNVPVPAGRLAGDLLVAMVATNNASTITPAGTGWTRVVNNNTGGLTNVRGEIWTRTATGSEGATIGFARAPGIAITPGVFRVAMVAYRNVASVGAVTSGTGGGTSQVFPAATTTTANSWVVRGGTSVGGATDWSTPVSPDVGRHDSGNVDRSLTVFDRPIAIAGPSGTATLTLSTARTAVRLTVVLTALV